MPKKSRSARVQQNTKRSNRPLVSTAYDEPADVDELDSSDSETVLLPLDLPMEKVETIERAALPLRPVATTESSGEDVARAAINKTVSRRMASVNANRQQQTFSRQQEYTFIRSDLITVALLTVLMVILLIVLAIFLSR